MSPTPSECEAVEDENGVVTVYCDGQLYMQCSRQTWDELEAALVPVPREAKP